MHPYPFGILNLNLNFDMLSNILTYMSAYGNQVGLTRDYFRDS